MDTYRELYEELHRNLHDGPFFSKDGVPYHAVQTVVVEAPTHGKESTSEAASLYVFMEAMHGYLTGEWQPLVDAWKIVEFFVPSNQESFADYNPSAPARYAPEQDTPDLYPVALDASVTVGQDPIWTKLSQKYGTDTYSMHWLADPDNIWGFGPLFNTFQRGPMEGVWNTIPQPCVDDLKYGGPNGYLDLYVSQDGSPPAQWKYTLASDADARAIQAVLFVDWLCKQQNKPGPPRDILDKATKMGDWLVYSMFDKYFMKIGTESARQPGYNMDAFHGLLSWYSAWGGPLQRQGWGFRIGCSHSHAGYANPYAAFVMSQNSDSIFVPEWTQSMSRQLELFAWLQSAEGAISGGCTNSWQGRYGDYPEGTATFYGMAYVAHPVYLNPPSNGWPGMNAWGMERVCMYYYHSRDAKVERLVSKWCDWVASHVRKHPKTGKIVFASSLEWEGQPDSDWNSDKGDFPPENTGLRCKVAAYGQDLGVMACMARALMFYAAVAKDDKINTAIDSLMLVITKAKDNTGCYSVVEKRADYKNFDNKVYVPPGWTGSTPLGDTIDGESTFFSIRKSVYEKDPMYVKIREQMETGKAPTLRVHRFWAQAEIAITFAVAETLGRRPPNSDSKETTRGIRLCDVSDEEGEEESDIEIGFDAGDISVAPFWCE